MAEVVCIWCGSKVQGSQAVPLCEKCRRNYSGLMQSIHSNISKPHQPSDVVRLVEMLLIEERLEAQRRMRSGKPVEDGAGAPSPTSCNT